MFRSGSLGWNGIAEGGKSFSFSVCSFSRKSFFGHDSTRGVGGFGARQSGFLGSKCYSKLFFRVFFFFL